MHRLHPWRVRPSHRQRAWLQPIGAIPATACQVTILHSAHSRDATLDIRQVGERLS
jgi:hypothetical protein